MPIQGPEPEHALAELGLAEAAMPADRRAFEAALRQVLRERARTIVDTEGRVRKRLQAAAARINEILASQPADWQQLQLTPLRGQIEAVLEGMSGDVTAMTNAGLASTWASGEAAVDRPLQAAGIEVQAMLPALDARVLAALRTFTAGRIRDVSAEALSRIDSAIGLAAIGAQTPYDAIRAVRQQLGTTDAASWTRARTIVRTELGQAYAVAQQQRIAQAVQRVPGLQKQWRRSGKIHSRWNHDAADGQVVDADQPFVLQTKGAGQFVRLMHPHDPKAPPAETINCGCTARPWMARWGMPPGGTPFSDREIELNPMKAAGRGWKRGR